MLAVLFLLVYKVQIYRPLDREVLFHQSVCVCGEYSDIKIDPNGRDYWSTSDPELIKQFFNSIGSGASVHDMSGWNHSTDAEFLGRDTFNDETGKFYTSYSTVENGVPTVVGVSYATNLKPGLTSDGFGFLGAFVYQYENEFWATLAYYTYEWTLGANLLSPFNPTQFYDGYTNWSVNPSGRITGIAPIIGFPPLAEKGGKGKIYKGGKQKSRDSSLNKYPKDYARWYH